MTARSKAGIGGGSRQNSKKNLIGLHKVKEILIKPVAISTQQSLGGNSRIASGRVSSTSKAHHHH